MQTMKIMERFWLWVAMMAAFNFLLDPETLKGYGSNILRLKIMWVIYDSLNFFISIILKHFLGLGWLGFIGLFLGIHLLISATLSLYAVFKFT